MRGAWPMIAVALHAGCFFKPAPPAVVDAEPPDARVDCTGVAFPAPSRIVQFDGNAEAEPTIAGNLLEIYYVGLQGMIYTMGYGGRGTTSETFAINPAVPFADPSFLPQDPSITTDGNLLVFRGQSGLGPRAYYVERTAGGTWSTPPRILEGVDGELMNTLDLSGDGLTLYFNDGNNNLKRFTRTSRSAPFVLADAQLASDFKNPTVSDDGLEIYYNDPVLFGTLHSRRTGLDQNWQPGAVMFTGVVDPDITQDGQTIVFKNSTGVSISQRVCSPL